MVFNNCIACNAIPFFGCCSFCDVSALSRANHHKVAVRGCSGYGVDLRFQPSDFLVFDDFFVEGLRDLDAEEGERIGIDPKQMNDLKKLNWKEGALSEEDTYASCAWKSKDHIFWGKVRFVRQKEGIYICTDSAEQGSWYARLSDKSAEYYETLFKDYWKDIDWMDSVESEEKQISVEEMFQLSDEEMVDAMGSHFQSG